MIDNTEKLIIYLSSVINSVYKILPLYEERNIGIKTYVESLLFELHGLSNMVDEVISFEYISLLSTLESIKLEVSNDGNKLIVKIMVEKLKNGENYGLHK